MSSSFRSIGNFIFDLILLNLIILSVSIVSFGILFLPLISIASYELNEVYFLENGYGAIFSTFKKLKNNIFGLLVNSIVHIIVIGLILFVSIVIGGKLTLVKIIINSLLLSFEFSFWTLYFKEKLSGKEMYKLAFVSMVNHVIVGFIAYLVIVLLMMMFFYGSYYLLFFLPIGYTLFFAIIYDKLITRMMKKFRGEVNEQI